VEDLRVPLPLIQKISQRPWKDHLYISNGGNILKATKVEWEQNKTHGTSYDFSYHTENILNSQFNSEDIIKGDRYFIVIKKIICDKWYLVEIINEFGAVLNEDYYSERDIEKLRREINEL
jgi:hypothetical protein